MNVISYLKNSIEYIMVQEELDSKDDVDKFIFESEKFINSGEKNLKIEITFFSVKILPKSIILQLIKLLKAVDITIYSMEHSLWIYLLRLGIYNRYYNNLKVIKPKRNIKAIGVGGSAGSLDKIISFVKLLPVVNISIFIVMHIKENEKSLLSDILGHHSSYSVVTAGSDMQIMPKTIYCAPEGFHLIAVGGYIYLTKDDKINFARPSIDVLFDSLAREYQDELLTILFCGYGKDGSNSLKFLKEHGSEIIIEEPNECQAKDMLLNAINTKNFDKKLKLNEMIEYLQTLLEDENIDNSLLDELLNDINNKYGYDFRNYQKNSLKRRVKITMNRVGINNFYEFKQEVLKSLNIFEELFFDFSINVTSFFRNHDVFKYLRDEVAPYLNTFHHIKIWNAGCSTGEEPYSIAIMLNELGLLKKSQIYATDFNSIVLKKASNGLFSIDNLKANITNYELSGGEKKFNDYFNINDYCMEIKPYLKEKILFFNHNLVTDGVINEFQLIICRNVFIYFDENLKAKVINLFNDSLIRNGFLLLGESENIIDADKKGFKVENRDYKIYKKRAII